MIRIKDVILKTVTGCYLDPNFILFGIHEHVGNINSFKHALFIVIRLLAIKPITKDILSP